MAGEDLKNPLEISDEEIANMEFPTELSDKEDDSEGVGENEVENEETTSSDDPEEQENDEEDLSDESTDDDANEDTDEEDNEDEEDPQDSSDEDVPEDKKEEELEDLEEEPSKDESTNSDSEKAKFYDEIMKPFKANGRMMQLKDVEEVRTFLAMGAGFYKKMAAMKPGLKILKMLENNGLMDESKLNHLIDIHKKDPNAISKLIKDSNIDPMDIDVEKSKDYKPSNNRVTDEEIELDNVLNDIKDTETYQATIDVIQNKLDEKSKELLVSNPASIRTINDHIQSGVYDQIMSIVDKDRALGRLAGLSDIEAYMRVGMDLQARQAAKQQSNQQQTETRVTASSANGKPNTSKNKDESLRKSRKRAASTTKSTTGKKLSPDFNPLEMSDEEIEKIDDISKFYL